MYIAKLIKPDTPLYNRLNEKIKQLDSFFRIKPAVFFPIWIMSVAGLSASEGIKIRNLFWVFNIDWVGIILFLGLSLLVMAALITKNNREEKNSVNSLQSKLPMIIATGLMAVFIISGISAYDGRTIEPVLLLFWGMAIYFLIRWDFTNKIATEKVFWVKIALIYLALGICLFMFGWNYDGGSFLTGIIRSVPYGLGYSAIGTISFYREVIFSKESTADPVIHYSDFAGFGITGTIFIIIAVLLGYKFDDPVISTAAIISLPFFVILLITPRRDHLIRAIYYPILVLAIFVVVRYPWFLLPLLMLFHFCRFYYYFRRQIIYPTFSTHI